MCVIKNEGKIVDGCNGNSHAVGLEAKLEVVQMKMLRFLFVSYQYG